MKSNERLNSGLIDFKIFALFMILCIIFIVEAVGITAYEKDSDTYVYDMAGVFDSTQQDKLEKKIRELKDKTGMDYVIVTTNDAEGKSAESYADDFYDENGFGTSKDHSGMLFLIDFDNRKIHISTTGHMIRILDDDRIDSILDKASEYMQSKEYYRCADTVIERAGEYVMQGVRSGQYNYDRETGEISFYKPPKRITAVEFILSFIISVIIAGINIKVIIDNYEMKKLTGTAPQYLLAYRSGAGYVLSENIDDFLGRHTKTRYISSGSSGSSRGSSGGFRSTTHTGSSGTRHGGGGRSF